MPSTPKSTHFPLHNVSPELHLMPHMLSMQVGVPAPLVGPLQTLLQPPQLFTSFLASTQAAPQGMNEPVHWYEQVPELQRGAALAGAVQTLPHSPQFDVSEVTSTHEPSQLFKPPQSVEHSPDLHTSAAPQACGQLPQWSRLVSRSTHLPSHSLYPGLHCTPHLLALHLGAPLAVPAHSFSQMPQLCVS
jgi:hypothetical protein